MKHRELSQVSQFPPKEVDPITLEVMRNALYSIADEMTAALVRTGQCVSPVTIELPGGELVVDVKSDWRVFMTGPAEEIYHGDLSSEFLLHLE